MPSSASSSILSFDQLLLSSSLFSFSSFNSNYLSHSISSYFTSIYNGLLDLQIDAIPGRILFSSYVSSFINLFSLSSISIYSSNLISFSSGNLFCYSFYLTLFSNYLILSLFSSIRLYISSFDVIHSFGFHSLGFKSDAIPGRLNFVSNLFLLSSGSYLGYCYELCGLGHTSMLSSLYGLYVASLSSNYVLFIL
jgi:hypothetical protein